jgi:hypothetical protein
MSGRQLRTDHGERSRDARCGIVLKGAKLETRGGRVKRVHTGECWARGTFACEGFVLAQMELARFDLPGTIDLSEGLEI